MRLLFVWASCPYSAAYALARSSTPSVRSQRARLRTGCWRRRTVSRLWLRMSGPASMTVRSGASAPLKSGIRTSTPISGLRARSSRIVAANAPAPPSGRSSRATLVTTTWSRFMAATASATRRGSSSSNQVGRPVLMAQNPQARVQVSPRIITVAVRWSQHSPMFGQRASSQTVLRLRPDSRPLSSW